MNTNSSNSYKWVSVSVLAFFCMVISPALFKSDDTKSSNARGIYAVKVYV